MATTYTVDDTGGGTHLTIAAALAVVISGDTVLISDGQTFAEGDLVALANATDITVKRTPGLGFALNLAGDGPPTIDAAGFTWALQFEDDWRIEGVIVENASGFAFQGGAGPPERAIMQWVVADSCGGLAGVGSDDCVVELAIARFCVGEAHVVELIGTAGNRVRSVLVYRSQGRLFAAASNGIIERCVWANGDVTAAGIRMFAGTSGGIIRNSIVFNPGAGCSGMSAINSTNGYNACCVILDDVGETPYIGHTPGEPPATCLETDPLFVDQVSDDYHLALGSPCRGTGTTEAESGPPLSQPTTDLDGDNHTSWRRSDMGAYAAVWGAGVIVRGVVKGTHLGDLIATTAIWLPEAESAHRWILLGVAEPGGNVPLSPVRVSRATIDPIDGRILHLRTDVPMLEGVTYFPIFDSILMPESGFPFLGTFLCAAGVDFFLNGPDVPNAASPTLTQLVADRGLFFVTGGRVSAVPLDDPDSVFLDFDAPIFDDSKAEGFGGGWRIGDAGDYNLVGGVTTIIKIVWATLLTRKGELKHDPDIGTRLRVKEPIPSLREEERFLASQLRSIPFVSAVRVTLSRPAANAIDIAVEVVTELGLIRTSRTVPRSLAA